MCRDVKNALNSFIIIIFNVFRAQPQLAKLSRNITKQSQIISGKLPLVLIISHQVNCKYNFFCGLLCRKSHYYFFIIFNILLCI